MLPRLCELLGKFRTVLWLRSLVIQAGVGAFVAIVVKVLLQPLMTIGACRVVLDVDVLVFHRSPRTAESSVLQVEDQRFRDAISPLVESQYAIAAAQCMLQGVCVVGNSMADRAKVKHVGHLRFLRQGDSPRASRAESWWLAA